MKSRVFWIRTILYVLLTVGLTTFLSSQTWQWNLGNFNVKHLSIAHKIIYSTIKILLALTYLKLVTVAWRNSFLILVIGLFFRYLDAQFTMVIIGCSIALYMKDSLINTNSKKINQNPD
jgi:hypothetical protein